MEIRLPRVQFHAHLKEMVSRTLWYLKAWIFQVTRLKHLVTPIGLVVEGWLGRGTTALHCTHHVLTHRLKDLSFFSFFLCLSPPNVRSGRAAFNGCRIGLWISLLATRLVVHHFERERFGANAREQSGSRLRVLQQCESCER